MEEYYNTIISNAKKSFTKDKHSIVKDLLMDDKNNGIKSIAFKTLKNESRGEVIKTYFLDDNNNIKHFTYAKNNGLIVLDFFKKDKVKLINLNELTKAK